MSVLITLCYLKHKISSILMILSSILKINSHKCKRMHVQVCFLQHHYLSEVSLRSNDREAVKRAGTGTPSQITPTLQ